METPHLSEEIANPSIPSVTTLVMLRLGLFQLGLGMMAVLLDGLLNRVMIQELNIPATLTSLVIAITLFVSPARVFFGRISDLRPLFGRLHRTSYVIAGAISFALLSFVAVQVMWQVGKTSINGWTSETTGWIVLLAGVWGLYGIGIAASSTPFATLLVDVTEEGDRSKLVGITWGMLTFGLAVGGIIINSLLKGFEKNPSLDLLQASINRLFLVVPLVVVGLGLVATWGVEQKYSRFRRRSGEATDAVPVGDPEAAPMSFAQAFQILTANRQSRLFFAFLLLMTLGLFLQNTILEPYGGQVFGLAPGATALLNSFFGSGALVGILLSGFLLAPRVGKKKTAQIGCSCVLVAVLLIAAAGFVGNPAVLRGAVLLFGLASGVTTTGAVTLFLDFTIAQTAGTFVGAWGLAQAVARGSSLILGGALLDVGKTIMPSLVSAYGLVFVIEALAMAGAIALLSQLDVQEFRTSAQKTLSTVIATDAD
jgi:MFS transporter, BCD family, chlorophyll transporter